MPARKSAVADQMRNDFCHRIDMRRLKTTIILNCLLLSLIAGGSLYAHTLPGDPSVSGAVAFHDFHVSITDINYNPKTNSLEIAVKIFTNDLEEALEGIGAPKLRMGTPREDKSTDSLLHRYLNHRLKINAGEIELELIYLGKEYEDDATWCYLEVNELDRPTDLMIENRILLEWFEDQSNLVHLNVAGDKKSLLMRKGLETGKVDF